MLGDGASEESKVPLLEDSSSLIRSQDDQDQNFRKRFWIESKKLWYIVGPSIVGCVASYTMLVVTQAFAGHLGDLELAAISIANNVVVGFDFGLLVLSQSHHTKFSFFNFQFNNFNRFTLFVLIFFISWEWQVP